MDGPERAGIVTPHKTTQHDLQKFVDNESPNDEVEFPVLGGRRTLTGEWWIGGERDGYSEGCLVDARDDSVGLGIVLRV